MRLDIVERLARRPMSVGELAAELPISRPAVSQHLKVLRQAALVAVEAEGTRRIYQVDPAGLGAVRQWLDRHWAQALAAYVEIVERED
jgi:DNA-binding transcriptional ArsR family regulator